MTTGVAKHTFMEQVEPQPQGPHAAEYPLIVESFAGRRIPPAKILIVKLDHLGDFIMALPALEYLRRAFPHAEITLVCGSWNAGIAMNSGIVDVVRTYDYYPANVLGWDERPVESVETFQVAAAGQYDLAIDLRVDNDTRFLLQHVDAKIRAGIGERAHFPFLDIIMMREERVGEKVSDNGRVQFPARKFDMAGKQANPFYFETDFAQTNRHVIWGPYQTLPMGPLRATFDVLTEGLGDELATPISFEVVHDGGRKCVERKVTQASELKGGRITIDFENEDEFAQFEFRIFIEEERPYAGKLRFLGVTVDPRGVDTGRGDRWKPSEMHKGEHMLLLATLVAERLRRAPLHAPPLGPAASAPSSTVQLPEGRNILLAPCSNSLLRDWPIDNYAKLAALLLKETDFNVVLLGTRDQALKVSRIGEVVGSDPRLVNLVGKTRWEEMPELLTRGDVLVCNNSGLAHISASLGVNTLAIYSGSHQPIEWGPRGENVHTITADVPCSPCGLDKIEQCRFHHRCMYAISPEVVFSRIRRILKL